MIDEELSPEEREEAEALAHALERGSAQPALPEDALEAAALLRYSQDGGALAEDRMKAILDEVLKDARPVEAPAARPALTWLRWLVPVAGLSAAAAAVAIVIVTSVEPPPPRAGLPAPGAGLLNAQARVAAEGSPEAVAALDEEMKAFRGEMYAALTERYGQ